MTFDGALITEQNVTFAIVIVKPHVLQSSSSSIEDTRRSFQRFFPRVPIILMAQNNRGVPTYHGRTDIVNFLVNIHISQIPWKTYTV